MSRTLVFSVMALAGAGFVGAVILSLAIESPWLDRIVLTCGALMLTGMIVAAALDLK